MSPRSLWMFIVLTYAALAYRVDTAAPGSVELCREGSLPATAGVDMQLLSAENVLLLRNGIVCAVIDLASPSVEHLSGDFDAGGHYGHNALQGGGVVATHTAANGTVFSSSDNCTVAQAPVVHVISNTTSYVAVTISGIRDTCLAQDAFYTVAWTLSLASWARGLNFSAKAVTTKMVPADTLRSVGHQVRMTGSSVYGLFKTGVVQMRANSNASATRYVSTDVLPRVYSLGGCCNVLDSAGNVSLSLVVGTTSSSFFPATRSPPAVALFSGDGSLLPFWTAVAFYSVMNTTANSAVPLDQWSCSTAGEAVQAAVPAGTSWFMAATLAPNDHDFPTLPGAILPLVISQSTATAPPVNATEFQAMVTGVYASAVGNLFTHMNEVAPGYRVGQIATTIHRPDVGYAGTYNYFDPDNYFSSFSLLSMHNDYLHEEVRRVLERSGSFLNEKGQLPHHFVGIVPVYQALSGATQTGPNIFWILSCFNYAKFSGNMDWLRMYMPHLRNASAFLFDMIDPQRHLLSAPGSLYIDVFIRNNFTSDSNGMIVGFLLDLADAEEFMGNASGASMLRNLSTQVATAMNALLMASSNDHYITQLNPNGSIRDFVDYDSNLISCAHGVPSTVAAAHRIMNRVDSGRCTHGRATFVSEDYYGPQDCVGGNIGDSWCSMGRNGWFDSLTRKRYNDLPTFDELILDPLIGDLCRWTWLWERYSCDGTPQLNRTYAYFEYPSVTSIMISFVRYGLQPGLGKFTIDPFRQGGINEGFTYQLGTVMVQVTNNASSFALALPASDEGVRTLIVEQLVPSAAYRIVSLTGCSHANSSAYVNATSTVSASGSLTFTVPVRPYQSAEGCTVNIVKQ